MSELVELKVHQLMYDKLNAETLSLRKNFSLIFLFFKNHFLFAAFD